MAHLGGFDQAIAARGCRPANQRGFEERTRPEMIAPGAALLEVIRAAGPPLLETSGPLPIAADQSASDEMISPPWRVAIPVQMGYPIVFLTKRTEPSSMVTLTPPLWNELAAKRLNT